MHDPNEYKKNKMTCTALTELTTIVVRRKTQNSPPMVDSIVTTSGFEN